MLNSVVTGRRGWSELGSTCCTTTWWGRRQRSARGGDSVGCGAARPGCYSAQPPTLTTSLLYFCERCHLPAYDTVPSAVFVYPQSWEREDTARQSPANWYELVPYMASSMHDPQAAHAGARPRTSAGRVRVKLDWVPPPGTSSVSDLNTTAELNVDANTVDSRPQSVGRAGTPLTMGPTTTHLTTQGGQSQPVKEDVVGMAQYAAAVE